MNKYNKKLRYNSTIRNIVKNVILLCIILRLKARSALI
jgi:hypothetical protein